MDTQSMIRNLACAAGLVAMLALSSCNAPGDSAAGAVADSKTPASQAAAGQPAAPAQLPATPAALPAATAAPVPAPAKPMAGPEGKTGWSPPTLGADPGRACRVDSDCAMKDAGSCCGFHPVCVNKDTPTFPEKVKAACANDGRVGICGFPAIDGCQCVAGKCQGVPMMENSVPLQ